MALTHPLRGICQDCGFVMSATTMVALVVHGAAHVEYHRWTQWQELRARVETLARTEVDPKPKALREIHLSRLYDPHRWMD